jgi:hypothetical protein
MESVTFKITVLSNKRVPDVVETRKFSISRSNMSLESICQAYGSDALFCYRDQENDLISLRTQADLDEYFRSVQPGQDGIFRLQTTKVRDSIPARVAKTSKQIAEEAIVLGVRGASWAGHKWNGSGAVPAVEAEQAPVVTPGTPPVSETSVPVESGSPPSPGSNNNASSKSLVVKIAEGGKQLAEEALVLGVRGVSYVEHQWHGGSPALQEIKSEQPQQPAAVPPAASSSPMTESWVNVEQSVASAPPAQQVVVSQIDGLVNELVAMGFSDREQNLRALQRCNNNVEDAVASLLGDQ